VVSPGIGRLRRAKETTMTLPSVKDRVGVVGASDIPTLIAHYLRGERHFDNDAADLYDVFMGDKEPYAGNWFTEQGDEMEPLILNDAEEILGEIHRNPPRIFSKRFPWFGTHLDGRCVNNPLILIEAKWTNKADASLENRPGYYWEQQQAQMWCIADAEGCPLRRWSTSWP
jgi:hypothetical protein